APRAGSCVTTGSRLPSIRSSGRSLMGTPLQCRACGTHWVAERVAGAPAVCPKCRRPQAAASAPTSPAAAPVPLAQPVGRIQGQPPAPPPAIETPSLPIQSSVKSRVRTAFAAMLGAALLLLLATCVLGGVWGFKYWRAPHNAGGTS